MKNVKNYPKNVYIFENETGENPNILRLVKTFKINSIVDIYKSRNT